MENMFLDEINGYSIEELQLIYSTQQDLYTNEEMHIIRERLIFLKDKFIQEHLPKTIICSKCDGENDFNNNNCSYCGASIDKRKFYNIEYYNEENNQEELDEIETENKSFLFQYIFSFIIPLTGFILGAILLSNDDENRQSVGKSCIVLGIISIILSIIIANCLF